MGGLLKAAGAMAKNMLKFIVTNAVKISLPYVIVPTMVCSIFAITEKTDKNEVKANEIKDMSQQLALKFYHIAGNEKTGYYYEFDKDIDERVNSMIEENNVTYGEFIFDDTQEDKELIKKMLKAEVVTYLPDLGGAPNQENEVSITNVEDLLNAMTVEERVRQMIIAIEEYAGQKESIEIPQVGGYVFNGTGEGVTPLIEANKSKYNNSSPSTVTPFYSADDEGGNVNRFLSGYPPQRDYTGGLGSAGTTIDKEAIRADYARKVPELKAAGINLVLAPVADVSTDESHAIGADGRSFGPNENIVKEAIVEAVTTLKNNQMASTLKHYPGYGSIDANPHEKAAEGQKITGPFVEGYKASGGTSAIMIGHFSYEGEGVPATLSRKVMDGLRKEMGNDALTITDSMSMGAAALQGMDDKRRFVESVDAGLDMVMPEESQVDDAVSGIMEAIQDKDQVKVTAPGASGSSSSLNLDTSNAKDLGDFLMTAYCGCTICSEGYGTSTSSGNPCTPGRTVAVDPNVIPEGSVILIGDDPTQYVAEDVGGAIIGNHIDIYYENHEEASNIKFNDKVRMIREGWGPEGNPALNGGSTASTGGSTSAGTSTTSNPSGKLAKEMEASADLTMGDGKLYMKQINDAVRRILNFKQKNGILDFSNMSAGTSSAGDAGGQDGYAIYPIPSYNTPEIRGQKINQVWGKYSYSSKAHSGTDISYEDIDLYPFPELYCAFPGTVTESGDKGNGLGCHVTVKADGKCNGQEVFFVYAHMSRTCVQEGQHVQDGDFIGFGGTTGNSTGPHLHYEIDEGSSGNDVNPYEYFPPGYVGDSQYGATTTGTKQIVDDSGNPIKITGQYRKPNSSDNSVNDGNSHSYGGTERLNPNTPWVSPLDGSGGTSTISSGGASTTVTRRNRKLGVANRRDDRPT